MNDRLELTLANQRSALARSQDELESFARQHGLPARVLHPVQLALEEHLTNIIAYGYDDPLEHNISVRVLLNHPCLRIEVEDDGHPFNPLEYPSPDLAKPIEDRPVGGLGIYMMRKSLDGIEYSHTAGRNRLVMLKRI